MLAQYQALAHLDLSGNQIGPDVAESLAGVSGAEILAGVLRQCAALAHLYFILNWIGARGLRESWVGPEGGMKMEWPLDSEESEEEWDWEDEELMFEAFTDEGGVYYKR